jgi:RNA polymerase sporulation-specific sigma factor
LRDDGAVKVSRGIKEQAAAIKSVRNTLTNLLGREPTVMEISHQTGFSPEEIALAETATAATESIQRTMGEEGFSLEDVLTDTDSEEKMLEKIALSQAIGKLPERERMVIQLRYFHGLTQDRVAKVLNVSQVQVSRIEKKAIGLLRELLQDG